MSFRSPSKQVGEGQPRATELIVEPDAEVVQSHPRRQTRPQPAQLVGPLPPQAKGIEKFVVDTLYDLADGGHPAPQALGPHHLAGVAFGWADEPRSIASEPSPVVLGSFETLVGHVGSREEGRAHTQEPGIRLGSHREEGLGQRLVGGRGGPEAKARDHPGGGDGGEKAEALVPAQAVGPSDVGVAGEPTRTPALSVSDGHRRAIQGFVRRFPSLQHLRQMQGRLFDELRVEANQPIELRAIGQGREGVSEMVAGVAVEVAFAGESRPPGEDGQGYDLTFGEGRTGAGPLFWLTGLAEVIHYDVECGEEGVHVDHEESVPFPSGSVLGKSTLIRGHLPLKFPTDNSHQAFKG